MTSNKWVADRVVDLLREKPEMGPKELLRSVPGSVVELETEEHNGDV